MRAFSLVAAVALVLVAPVSNGCAATLWSAAAYHRKTFVTEKVDEICSAAEHAAHRFEVPHAVFTRLLWHTRFDPAAKRIDRRRAEGTAAASFFTSKTDDDADVTRAIPAAAAYLSRLRARFGNVGLAVAAYDLGEDRFVAWMTNGSGRLPTRTENFVYEVTGVDAQEFLHQKHPLSQLPVEEGRSLAVACTSLPAFEEEKQARVAHDRLWAAIVSGNFRHAAAKRSWTAFAGRHPGEVEDLHPSIERWVTPLGRAGMYTAKIYSSSRDAATQICNRLHGLGGTCIVLRD